MDDARPIGNCDSCRSASALREVRNERTVVVLAAFLSAVLHDLLFLDSPSPKHFGNTGMQEGPMKVALRTVAPFVTGNRVSA
jgi:hypothetical protein